MELISTDISVTSFWDLHEAQTTHTAANAPLLCFSLLPSWSAGSSQLPRTTSWDPCFHSCSGPNICNFLPTSVIFSWENVLTLLFRVEFKDVDSSVYNHQLRVSPFLPGKAQLTKEIELLGERGGLDPSCLFYRMQHGATTSRATPRFSLQILLPTLPSQDMCTHTHTHTLGLWTFWNIFPHFWQRIPSNHSKTTFQFWY